MASRLRIVVDTSPETAFSGNPAAVKISPAVTTPEPFTTLPANDLAAKNVASERRPVERSLSSTISATIEEMMIAAVKHLPNAHPYIDAHIDFLLRYQGKADTKAGRWFKFF